MFDVKILAHVFGHTKNPIVRSVILYRRNIIELIIGVNFKLGLSQTNRRVLNTFTLVHWFKV